MRDSVRRCDEQLRARATTHAAISRCRLGRLRVCIHVSRREREAHRRRAGCAGGVRWRRSGLWVAPAAFASAVPADAMPAGRCGMRRAGCGFGRGALIGLAVSRAQSRTGSLCCLSRATAWFRPRRVSRRVGDLACASAVAALDDGSGRAAGRPDACVGVVRWRRLRRRGRLRPTGPTLGWRRGATLSTRRSRSFGRGSILLC